MIATTPAYPSPPWRTRPGLAPTGDREVEAVRTITVAAPAEVAAAVVNDIASIHRTERKADTVELVPETATTGTYHVTGHLARLVPWRATFRYWLRPDGFHSVSVATVGRGWEVAGGFVVEPIDAMSCRVLHYEQYLLRRRARLVRRLVRAYMHRSMRGELRDLARRAELLTRGV